MYTEVQHTTRPFRLQVCWCPFISRQIKSETMYQEDLPVDQSALQDIERRRASESARKERIFNTRLRVMGLDLHVLEKQVQDRKHQEHLERQRDRVYDYLRLNQDEALVQQDNSEKQRRKDLHSDLTKYWSTFQRVEDSRDADLKIGQRGALALSVPESELGPASMQIFEVGVMSLTDAQQPTKQMLKGGEDQSAQDRIKEQMKITERNLRSQKEDCERRRMAEKHRDTLRGQELIYEGYRGVEMQALEEECRRASRMALDNYNRALATEQAERQREEERREERENAAEIWHTVTSDLMTESSEATERCRVAVLKERDAQCVEKQKQQDKERNMEASFKLQLLNSALEAEEEEQRVAEQRRQRRAEVDHFNRLLANEQQRNQEHLDKIVYTNKPTKDYFRQFTTSSR